MRHECLMHARKSYHAWGVGGGGLLQEHQQQLDLYSFELVLLTSSSQACSRRVDLPSAADIVAKDEFQKTKRKKRGKKGGQEQSLLAGLVHA